MFAQKDKTVKFGVTQYDDSRLARGRVILSVVLTVSLLLAPIFVLFLVDMPRVAMVCIVFGFVVLFAVLVALLTEGRPQDVLLGTAACAFTSPNHASQADILSDMVQYSQPSSGILIV